MTYLGAKAAVDARAFAKGALDGLSDKDKVHFALALMMEATDPDAHAALRYASNQLVALTEKLPKEGVQ